MGGVYFQSFQNNIIPVILMFAPCINSIKKLLLFQLMHTIIKITKC